LTSPAYGLRPRRVSASDMERKEGQRSAQAKPAGRELASGPQARRTRVWWW
jgi:hypothetical protein